MVELFNSPIPPLRHDLEASLIEHEGQPLYVLSDRLGLDPESFAVPAAAAMIASLFDGKLSASDIRAELARQNVPVTQADVQGLADDMARRGLLETGEAREKRKRLYTEFKQSSLRRTYIEARGLSKDPIELGRFLNQFYKDPAGPGEPGADGKAALPLGLVVPHIDFFRGGAHYAWAYRELAQCEPPDVVVAVGVAHMSPQSPWVLTRKSYETPFGSMQVHEELYADIRKALWYDPEEEEVVHAKEHSLEFQALWLKHVWPVNTPRWVPILCSAFEFFCEDKSPASIQTVETAHLAIGELLKGYQRQGQRVMVLAAVDLAHVGRKFGDDLEVTDTLKAKIESLDRASLEDALAFKTDAFFKAGTGEQAWRKVCGLSALYTSLRWIEALGNGRVPVGKLLSYGQALDPAGGIVSFASAVFK